MTMNPAVSKWNERFLESDDYIFGTEPNDFVARHRARFKPGMKVLAIADG